MPGLKQRARTLQELAENALFLIYPRPLPLDSKAHSVLTEEAKHLLKEVFEKLESNLNWQEETLENDFRSLSESLQVKMGSLAQPLRAALTGQTVSPSIFEVMIALGKEETLGRIQDVLYS
jgi:glutamyl-tRNA synthetase